MDEKNSLGAAPKLALVLTSVNPLSTGCNFDDRYAFVLEILLDSPENVVPSNVKGNTQSCPDAGPEETEHVVTCCDVVML